MAKGNICCISNCKNIITYKGKMCGTHKWRWAKFRSYDLPNHKGEPNKPIIITLPNEIVKECEKHGYLKINECYLRYYKNKVSSYYCKKCILSLNIKNKYKGMEGLECYEKLSEIQNNVCKICKMPNEIKRNGKIKRLMIDHCHKSLKIRGLLCHHCNALLGYAKDSIEILKEAIKYLEEASR